MIDDETPLSIALPRITRGKESYVSLPGAAIPARARYVAPPTQGPLVLVVAEDSDDAALFQEAFHGEGLRVELREDGDEALHFLQSAEPDLLVIARWDGRLDGATFVRMLEQVAPGMIQRTVAVGCGGPGSALHTVVAQEGVPAIIEGRPDLAGLRSLVEHFELVPDLDQTDSGIDLLNSLLIKEGTRSAGHSVESAPEVPTLMPGSTWADRFVVGRILGVGATSVVYEVRDQLLGNRLALKILSRPQHGDNAVERFRREAAVTREIVHPNVVRTFDYGMCHGSPWFTMDLLLGETFEDVIRRDVGKPGWALGLLSQAFEGLAATHRARVVHRDIKPGNLHVSGEGLVRLFDYGIARIASHRQAITREGLVLGSPRYMAPERLGGSGGDETADIWALGAVGYELLTGRHPYPEGDLATFVAAVTSRPPLPPSRFATVSRRVDDLIGSLLATEPSARPSDGRQIAKELKLLALSHGLSPDELRV